MHDVAVQEPALVSTFTVSVAMFATFFSRFSTPGGETQLLEPLLPSG